MSLRVREDEETSGFRCHECGCTLKDSSSYSDHVRGKKHNRNIGISLKNFTDSTLNEVKQMLEFKKRERERKLQGDDEPGRDFIEDEDDEEDEGEEEKYRKMRREKKKRQKARRAGQRDYQDDDDDEDDDDNPDSANEDTNDTPGDEDPMARIMGFSSFSSGKK